MTHLILDEMGRITLPEAIRQTLGLEADTQFTLEIQDGKIVLEPSIQSPQLDSPNLEYKGRVLVIQSELLTSWKDIDLVREDRIQKQMSL